MPIMYEIPSDNHISKVIITKGCVLNGEKPLTETSLPSKTPTSLKSGAKRTPKDAV